MRQRPLLAPAGDPAIDEARIAHEAVLGAEAEPLHDPRTEALDQGVGTLNEPQGQCRSSLALQIERHGRAAAQQQIVAQLTLEPEIAWFRPVDAQHARAEIGEQHSAHRSRPDAGEFNNFDAGERSHRRLLLLFVGSVRGLTHRVKPAGFEQGDEFTMSGPLAGIRVIDLTSAVLGPVATQILGDMGAEVIKIEPPQGDPVRPLGPSRHPGMGAYFLSINRNKKSVALDLKRPAAREALLRLMETADVFVHNMRLAAAERLGLDYAAVASRNPSIVYAAATGFRKDGVHRDRPSFDDVIQGESGLAALNGGPGGEPRYVPMAVCDKICGYVLASAVGMALFHRERTGNGQEVHVAMLETMVAFNLVDHLWHGVLAEPEK